MVPGQEEVRIGIVARIRSLPLAGLVLLGAMSSGLSTSLPEWVRFAVAVAALVWIPGALILDRVFRFEPPSPFVRFPLRLLAGISCLSIVTWLFTVAGTGFGAYAAAIQWLLAALFAATWWAEARAGRRPVHRSGSWAHLALLAALGAFVALQPGTLSADRDAFDHIGYVRCIEDTGELAPPGVLAVPADGDASAARDPRKGAFHDVVALVCRLSALEPVAAWRMLPAVVFPFAFFAFVAFCRVFLRSAWAVAVCCALFAVSYGGVGYRYGETALYGQNLAVVWYWVLVPLVVAGRADGAGKRLAALVALLGAGGVWVHVGAGLYALVLVATIVVFARWLRTPMRPALALAASVLVALVWKVAWLGGGTGNLIHTHPQGLLYLTPRWFVVSPLEVLRQHGLLFLGGLAIAPLVALCARRSREAARELVFAVIPLGLCFIPFVATPLVGAASYMVSRTLLCVAAFPMIVTAFACTASWARRTGWWARVAAAVVLVAWALVFVAPTARAFARSLAAPAGVETKTLADALVDYVRRLPAGSVVLSDPRTSYELSALTDQRFVTVAGQHGTPYDTHALDRLAAVRDVLSPYAVSRATLAACDRYGVDFVVVNAAQPSRAAELLSVWDATLYSDTVRKLGSIAGRFRDVYDGATFTVFLYDPAGEGGSVWGPSATPLRYETDAAGAPCHVDAPGQLFSIESVAVAPDTVLPGESVRITLGYSKPDRSTFGLPYTVSIRLDNERVDLGRGPAGLKFVRRFRERRDGALLRYTLMHRPFEGLCDEDLWPIGVPFYESFKVTLPAGLATGAYAVRISVERDSLLPNFTLADLVYNRDRLTGEACSTLVVSAQRTRSP